jgi:hypothetical protein
MHSFPLFLFGCLCMVRRFWPKKRALHRLACHLLFPCSCGFLLLVNFCYMTLVRGVIALLLLFLGYRFVFVLDLPVYIMVHAVKIIRRPTQLMRHSGADVGRCRTGIALLYQCTSRNNQSCRPPGACFLWPLCHHPCHAPRTKKSHASHLARSPVVAAANSSPQLSVAHYMDTQLSNRGYEAPGGVPRASSHSSDGATAGSWWSGEAAARVKASLRKGFQWIKDRCTGLVRRW